MRRIAIKKGWEMLSDFKQMIIQSILQLQSHIALHGVAAIHGEMFARDRDGEGGGSQPTAVEDMMPADCCPNGANIQLW